MKDVRFGTHAGLPASNPEHVRDTHEATSYPTPAEVLAQIARVIAFCLGLAVLAHVLVASIGAQ